MDAITLRAVSDAGTQLAGISRLNKDVIVKSLRQAVSAVSQIEQSSSLESSREAGLAGTLEHAIKPLRKALLQHGLLLHADKDVKLLVAICVTEMFRILAPEPPFEDDRLRDVFKVILSMFAELADTASPYFSRRAKILETVARCKCCVIMLDIGCNDLVVEMFHVFFYVARDHHQQSLTNDMLSIMAHILSEEPLKPLLDIILKNLLKKGKAGSNAAYHLAVTVIQTSAEQLEPFICGFLTSCSLNRDSIDNDLKEFYHEILFEVFLCAPQMLLAVIPNLTQELLTDQVDVRIKALNLIGRLFSVPDNHVSQKYQSLFIEFRNRFTDKSVEVRLSALRCAKACYMSNPSGKESHEILDALEGRLLDFDDKVRIEAVVVLCDLARKNLRLFPPDLVAKATERLRDKKISVRKKALQKLMEVYRDYCSICAEGRMIFSDHFEQIPSKVLMLCYDKDCKDFRSQNMELILSEDLFPATISAAEMTRHWIHLFSLFSPLHAKVLNHILSQKRRLQTEMHKYLTTRRRRKKKKNDGSSREIESKTTSLFTKMAALFPDSCHAEDCFHKLDQLKDNRIFNSLEKLLHQHAVADAEATRDDFLKLIGSKHHLFEFLSLLSSKCSFNIFGSDHVCYALDFLSRNESKTECLEHDSAKLFLVIVTNFPSLLVDAEERLPLLLEQKGRINDTVLEALARARPEAPSSSSFSCCLPKLEKLCLDGTRLQSKLAVSAISSLIDSSNQQPIFTKLCEELLDGLRDGYNTPTILQSLGCIAQLSVPSCEPLYGEISSYIFKNLLQAEDAESNDSCKLKIYGLKALTKLFLSHGRAHVSCHIDQLLNILSNILQTRGEMMCCSNGDHHLLLPLVAAKSILRLARKWDFHIHPLLFRNTVLMAKDSSPSVRAVIVDKIHRLLKERKIPIRYACAFAFAASDCCKDTQDVSNKYMEEFVQLYTGDAQAGPNSLSQGESLTEFPAYILVFLVYLLAHDAEFPLPSCQDEHVYAQFCRPLFSAILALTGASFDDDGWDCTNDTALLCLLGIFRAIKKAEDADDSDTTPKLQLLAEIGIQMLLAFRHRENFSSCVPAMVLLPSSFYTVSHVKNNGDANVRCAASPPPPPPPLLNENLIKRIVLLILKSQIGLFL